MDKLAPEKKRFFVGQTNDISRAGKIKPTFGSDALHCAATDRRLRSG